MRNQFIIPKTSPFVLARVRKYDETHRIQSRKKAQQWYKQNKKRVQYLQRRWHKRHPWWKSYSLAKQRCTDPKVNKFEYYGGKGIKFLLSIEDVIFLWNRDSAASMKNPTIDRIHSEDNYILRNCQFLEFNENRRKRSGSYHWDTKKPKKAK